jgi:hypothetical protein
MYRSHRQMWEGWTKNLYPLVGATPRAVAKELMLVIPWLPVVLLLGGLVHRYFAYLGLTLLLFRHAVSGFDLWRNRYPLSRIIYYLVGAFWYAAALLASAWRYAHGSVTWKGREIPIGAR